MSAIESTLQPTLLRQRPPYDPAEILALFDLFTWLRGDMRLGQIPNFGPTAGSTTTNYIEPPDDTEEWEVLYVNARDLASIDANDNVTYGMQDGLVATETVILQFSNLSSGGLTGFYTVFPNRATAQSNASIVTSVGDSGWFAKKRDSKTPDKRFFVIYGATATVGTRNVTITFIYRRRRLK